MTEASVVDIGEWPGFRRVTVQGPAGPLSVRLGNEAGADTVLFNHSILTGSAVWHRQATWLAAAGWRVICLDSRGHGTSPASPAPYRMDDLVADNIAVLDSLGIAKAHYVGVSQGGMTGFGLGIRHPDRIASLLICAARADAPQSFAAAWDDRIALVRRSGIDALAVPTAERWFGADFLNSEFVIAADLLACIRQTLPEGFVGCAQAIQGLDYLGGVPTLALPVSLVIGSRDALLLEPMRQLAQILPHADYVEIDDAGHLPQIDRPTEFDRVLRRHLHIDGF
ncbi:MAG: alpha/beta hydrolase [Tardiphaga sp.]